MASLVSFPVTLLCIIGLHLTFASPKNMDQLEGLEKAKLSEKSNIGFKQQVLIKTKFLDRNSGKYDVPSDSSNYGRSLDKGTTYRVNSHRYRRGVLSWIASYFQSDAETSEQLPQTEASTEDSASGLTTPTLSERSNSNQDGGSQKRQGIPGVPGLGGHGGSDSATITRVPRTTVATGATDLWKKVSPQDWLSTVSNFLHSATGSSTDETRGNGETPSVAHSALRTPGPTLETPPHGEEKQHKIRHLKHHPEKLHVGQRFDTIGPHRERVEHSDLTQPDVPPGHFVGNPRNQEGLHPKERVDGQSTEEESSPCKTCGPSTSHSATAPKVMLEKEVKAIRRTMVADLLMQKLRLDARDLAHMARNFSLADMKLPLLPRAVLDETREKNSLLQEKDDFYARDQEAIVAGEDMGRDCIGMRATGCYNFRFHGEVKGEVESASLWLYKTKDRRDVSEQNFIVYELDRIRRSQTLCRRNLIAREGTYIKEGWVTVNMTRPVRRWLEKRRDGEMLAIRCKTCETHNYRAIFGTKHGYKPLLIIKYVDKHSVRERRSEPDCDPTSECCKRPLTVNFHDINMPTILQPANLQADYCFGSCNSLDSFTYNHTALKQKVRWSDGTTNQMQEQLKPCCVPLQLKDTYILIVENYVIVRTLLPKVIVETCGCL